MDFLTLFILYSGLLLLTVIACIRSRRKESFSSKLTTWVTQVLSHVIPMWVQIAAQKAVHRLFHTRNNFFVILHLILEVLVCGEYTWEVFGYCHNLEFNIFPLLLPYLLLVANVSFFVVCSKTNPGTITKSNQPFLLHTYACDGVMFQQGVKCLTCRVKKPARSKHCRVCNSCVHRFDHHCIWVNNCIGAFNTRYFLGYLLTLISLAVSTATLTAGFLIQVVLLSNVMMEHYTDDQGQEHPVDTFFIIQHLFLAFPRILFMLGFVIILSVILGSYFCFILYLVLINQTSNEWFTSAKYTCSSTQKGYKNIYSKGLWANIAEVLQPHSPSKDNVMS